MSEFTRKSRSILRAVTTISPLRVSLAGGGTDIVSYYTRHGGAVVSFAIDQYVYVTVKRHSPLFGENYRLSYSKTEHVKCLDDIENDIARECLRLMQVDPPLFISTAADLPALSGLGSSSSFAVGLLYALHTIKGEEVSAGQLARKPATSRSMSLNGRSESKTSMRPLLGVLTTLPSDVMVAFNWTHCGYRMTGLRNSFAPACCSGLRSKGKPAAY